MTRMSASQPDSYEGIEQELRALVPESRAVASGKDERGVVTVTLRGTDFDVELVEDWARRLPAEELTEAISEALTAAEIARFDRRTITAEPARKEPVETSEPAFDGRIVPAFREATAGLDDEAFARSLDALLESVQNAALERLRASGPNGIATVRLGPDRRVNHVVIDPAAADGRSAAEIRKDIAQAIVTLQSNFDAPLHIDGTESARN